MGIIVPESTPGDWSVGDPELYDDRTAAHETAGAVRAFRAGLTGTALVKALGTSVAKAGKAFAAGLEAEGHAVDALRVVYDEVLPTKKANDYLKEFDSK